MYKEVLEQAENFKKFADSYKPYVSMRKTKTEMDEFFVNRKSKQGGKEHGSAKIR